MLTGAMSLARRSWHCATKDRCAPKCQRWPKCCTRRATKQPASASAATQLCAASTTTSSTQAGAVGTKDAAPRRRTSTRWRIPELDRLAGKRDPFFLFLRHMDPHSPYLPPEPYERMFYHGNETDKQEQVDGAGDGSSNPSVTSSPVGCRQASPTRSTSSPNMMAQLPTWTQPSRRIFTALEARGILADSTIVVINGDHGETLYDHDCWFDHHGMYEQRAHVPLIIRYPGKLPAGTARQGLQSTQRPRAHLVGTGRPAPLEIAFDGRSLMPMVRGEVPSFESEFYITECTWMRKHGWRTPQWKLMIALEPDFHFKPRNRTLQPDRRPRREQQPGRTQKPSIVASIDRARMEAWIAKREAETACPTQSSTNPAGMAKKASTTSAQLATSLRHTAHRRSEASRTRLQAESRK
jgi:hypothetical protein